MRIILLGVLMFISSCATNSGVVATGPDTYMYSKQAATGFSGLGNLKAEVVAEAGKYCIAQKKYLKVTDSAESKGPYIFGNYPRAEIQFTCVDKPSLPEDTKPKKSS